MSDLSERIRKLAADIPPAPFSDLHGVSSAFGDGQECESARLQPLIEALVRVAGAARAMVDGASLYDGVDDVDEALARLERLVGGAPGIDENKVSV